jgi:hypothetical protein
MRKSASNSAAVISLSSAGSASAEMLAPAEQPGKRLTLTTDRAHSLSV